MARQIDFYMHTDDLRLMEDALRSRWNVEFFPASLSGPSIEALDSIQLDIHNPPSGSDELIVYAYLTADRQKIVVYDRPNLKDWTVNPRESPVIQMCRSYFDGKVLKRGRFYYVPEVQSAESKKVAEAIRRLVRKNYEGPGIYLGPGAAKWKNDSGGEFRQL